MTEILDALYRAALEQPNLSRWLFNNDIARSYSDACRHAEAQYGQLKAQLSEKDLALFETYSDNNAEANDGMQVILFNQGIAIGIFLATMGRQG